MGRDAEAGFGFSAARRSKISSHLASAAVRLRWCHRGESLVSRYRCLSVWSSKPEEGLAGTAAFGITSEQQGSAV